MPQKNCSYYGVAIDPDRLPAHIGIIMDGNGRWARRRGKPRTHGHRAGSKSVRRVVRSCRSIGVSCLTLYAFSAQNWNRPEKEVTALMALLGEFIVKEWQEIMEKDIRVVHLGELRRVPKGVRDQLKELIKASSKNKSMTLALALSYGAREEIVYAARKLVRKVSGHKIKAADIDEETISSCLYTGGLPDPDLIVRTGGERRISNFLLWQSAYAEYSFSEKLWPDYNEKDLMNAIVDFQKRKRRFGLTDEQAQKKN